MLEASLQKDNSFLTLTYKDETLPITSDGLPTLNPQDFTLWLKRLRKEIAPLRVRYFMCGEYGTKTERPHYHAIVFGLPPCLRGQTKIDFKGIVRPLECCPNCARIQRLWYRLASNVKTELGLIYCGDVNPQSAAYVCSYVDKKMTKADDFRLNGRHPEYARMSKKPGLGLGAMDELASVLLKHDLEKKLPDVPAMLMHGKRLLPLGRYLRMKLRARIGRDEKAPQEILDQMAEKLRPLRESAFDNSRSFAKEIVEHYTPTVRSREKREDIMKQKRRKDDRL